MVTEAPRAAFHGDDLTPQVPPWRVPKGEVVVRIAVGAADRAPVQPQLTQPLRWSRDRLQQCRGLVPTVAVGA